jgi:hypothetical protein
MLLWLPLQAYESCGSATCTLNTDWDQGILNSPGLAMDLRYEYIDQQQLREGSLKTSVGAGEAVETRTVNRVLRAALDYTFDENWGGTVNLPLLNREHTHILMNTLEPESWTYAQVGDVRIIGRYQPTVKAFQRLTYGFNVGVKLPTGATDIVNETGISAERVLQPGSGTTDILLGAYASQAIMEGSGSVFIQTLVQHALNSYDQFMPGNQFTVDLGVSYKVSSGWGVLLQLNAQHRERDEGINAETDLSGGRYVYISPGISYALGESTQLYGFIQHPVYQYVNGTQLTSDLNVAMGVRHRF